MDNEKKYSTDNIQVLSDPIPVIRRSPRMFIGAEQATGEALAARMMSTLICLGDLPAKVSKLASWWLISSELDWLVKEGRPGVEEAFSQVVPLQGYVNSHRSEVLLTAFADAVVTLGTDGLKWVSGHAGRFALPDGLELFHPPGGRTVAFVLEGTATD